MAIIINEGFDVNSPATIDKRLLVDRVDGTTASLVSLTPQYNYANMYVWVKEEKAFYYLNDTVDDNNNPGATVSDWTKLLSGGGGCAKSGYVAGSAFTTNSQIATASVVFDSPYSGASYSVAITGLTNQNTDGYADYVWSVNNIQNTGFVIQVDVGTVPLGATAMWITNCFDGTSESGGGAGPQGPTGPGGESAIDSEEIAFGTGAGITSSSLFTFDNSNTNLILGNGTFPSNPSYYSAMIGGVNNKITGGISSLILGSSGSCIISVSKSTFANSSVIIGSKIGEIRANYSSQISNLKSSICDSYYSSSISNNTTEIRDSLYTTSISSYKATICGSSHSTIISSNLGFMTQSNFSAITGGCKNQINIGYNSIISGGYCNEIRFGLGSSIIGGKYNSIDTTPYSSIIAGQNNTIFCAISAGLGRAVIIGGADNSIACKSQGSLILGGNQNIITQSSVNSAIQNSLQSSIYSSNCSMILGGLCNKISGALNSSIINSTCVKLCENYNSSIVASCCSCIVSVAPTSGNSSVMFAGLCNKMYGNSSKSAIIGGYCNTMTFSSNSLILGGRRLKMDSLDDFVYVPSLRGFGSLQFSFATTSVYLNLSAEHFTVLVYPNPSTPTITKLPFASDAPHRLYVIKKDGSSTQSVVRIEPQSGDEIEGYSSYIELINPWDYNILQSDGVNLWIKLGGAVGLNL